MRRYFVPPFFGLWDARVHHLDLPKEHWDENVKSQQLENRARLLEEMKAEYGTHQFERKLKDFQDIDDSPLSIVSYHNLFFWQARNAFVFGAYYPALTSATALGERILNHLILDLRDAFRSKATYKRVHRKESIDDWDQATSILDDWNVLEPGISEKFRELKLLRHRSLHFNTSTYTNLRDDALSALQLLRAIIAGQFGAFGTQRWFIPGTKGAYFIKKDYESNPFVQKYYLPQCPYVGYRYSLKFISGTSVVIAFDQEDYGSDEISDSEYSTLYNERKFEELAPDEIPATPGIITWMLAAGHASRVTLELANQPGSFAPASEQP
jgi:hypothetical protein